MSPVTVQTAMNSLMSEIHVPYESEFALGASTSYRIGGNARILGRPESVEQLAHLTSMCQENGIAIHMLGSGANLLVRDEGVDLAIRFDSPAFSGLSIDGNRVTVGAGYDVAKLTLDMARAGLSGLECMAGIPASVGGAVRMNAGGAFGEIGTHIVRVRVMDDAGNVRDIPRESLVFDYRHANIEEPYIIEVEFELTSGDADDVRNRVKDVFAYKKASQPLGDKSAGCTFKNPEPTVSAGQLIDQAGLKGFCIGGAEVSDCHANFIVADPDAKTADVIAVMEHIEETVFRKFGVSLQREVVVW